MAGGSVVVLDVGKTLSKATLWTAQGRLVDRRTRPNAKLSIDGHGVLDVDGIERFFVEALTAFARAGDVAAIIPVAHGAAAAILRDGRLAVPPPDYESPIDAGDGGYASDRDPFATTGSPALPNGLNLGAQLDALDRRHPGLLENGATIVTWPQYWAWRLSGVAAIEVTSLGCHSDLWDPVAGAPSRMTQRRGWARLFAPLRGAGEVLGTITDEWAGLTGLRKSTLVYCGLHDSNAALLAARGFDEIANQEATVLSTGTWFVAMRTPAPGVIVDLSSLSEARDSLVNVDAFGRAVPSARFMGGREIELLTGIDSLRVDIRADQPALIAALLAVLAAGAMVLPTAVPGVGPFPDGEGGWVAEPFDAFERRAAVSLYAALVADAALDLIGARDRILIEGRFAEAEVFVRGLATLRPDTQVYVSNAHNDVSYGALRLIDPTLPPPSALVAVAPLEDDIRAYRDQWRAGIAQLRRAA